MGMAEQSSTQVFEVQTVVTRQALVSVSVNRSYYPCCTRGVWQALTRVSTRQQW